MKRWLSLALALCLLAAGLSGCGKKEEKQETSSQLDSSAVSSLSTPVPVQMAKAVRVTADVGLNVRSQPSTDAEILGLAEYHTMLPLLVETATDGWYQVEYEGKTAYVFAEYAEKREITLSEYNKLRAGETIASPTDSPESDDDDPEAVKDDPESIDDDPQKNTGNTVSSSPAGTPSPSPDASKKGHDEDGE